MALDKMREEGSLKWGNIIEFFMMKFYDEKKTEIWQK